MYIEEHRQSCQQVVKHYKILQIQDFACTKRFGESVSKNGSNVYQTT